MKRTNVDLIGSLIGLVTAAVFWAARGKWTWLSAIFPDFVLVALAALSAALLARSLIRPTVQSVFEGQHVARTAVTAVLILIWIWGVQAIGFVVSSFLAMLVILFYLARGDHAMTLREYGFWVAVTAAVIGFFYVVFTKVLYVPLPSGWLF